jgi:hypothetical protein
MLSGAGIDSANHFRKELAVDVGKEDSQRVRPPRDEASSGAVGRVVEAFDHGPDAAPGVVPDRLLAVQNAGNGRDRHGRGAGDVANCYRQRWRDRWKSACVIVYIEPTALCNSVAGACQARSPIACATARKTNGEAPPKKIGGGAMRQAVRVGYEADEALCRMRARPDPYL